MRRIAHLSDLHFDRVNRQTLEPLARAVASWQPHLVIVSGDLTQRARTGQFRGARALLDLLPSPQLVVPGNHDVPFFNVAARFLRPLTNYRHVISDDLEPSFVDDEMAVLGVNTARSLAFKGGRISRAQVARVGAAFGQVGERRTRIVVTHHPFDLPPGVPARDLVGGAPRAMRDFATWGVDLFLSGHLHMAHAGSTMRYAIEGYTAIVIQAGTATSNRTRGEVNSFNLIEVDEGLIGNHTWTWRPEAGEFRATEARHFTRSAHRWVPA